MSIRDKSHLPTWHGAVSAVGLGLKSLVQGVGFWTAVVLPALYIPMVAADPAVIDELWNFWVFVVLHVAALFVGHGHHVFDSRIGR